MTLLSALVLLFLAGGEVDASTVWTLEDDAGRLHGTWTAANDPVAGALLVHQCDRERSSPITGYEALIPTLTKSGVSSLALDLRGYGGSRKEASAGRAVTQADDIATAVEELVRRLPAGTPVALLGASCGGREGLRVANRDERIAALVLLSSRLPADLLPRSGLPVLAIRGTSDPYGGPLATIERVIEASGHEGSRLISYKTSLHGTPLLEHDSALAEEIVRWILAMAR